MRHKTELTNPQHALSMMPVEWAAKRVKI
jgi:hypothetical protein